MPPPTSPTSPHSPMGTRPLTPLSYLSSPVPDFAATLRSTEAAERADEANVSFLRDSLDELERISHTSRTHIETHRDPRRRPQARQSQAQAQTAAAQTSDTPEDLSRRERLQRVLQRLNRLHEPAVSSHSAYSNRTPSPNRQSLYDWAPSYNDNNHQQGNELDNILDELRRDRTETHPDIQRVLSHSQSNTQRTRREGNDTPAPGTTAAEAAERRERLRDRERRRRETEWVSLRARAAIQRSRREGSPSATERMLRYVMERERSGISEEEDRARASGWFRPNHAGSSTAGQHSGSRTLPSLDDMSDLWSTSTGDDHIARDLERQERIEAFRRGYLAENVPSRLPRISTPPPVPSNVVPPNVSTLFLENALRYLDELRSIPGPEGLDSGELRERNASVLDLSIDHGLATPELWGDKHDDFVMDVHALRPLPYSSWLQPGTSFEGHQLATNSRIPFDMRPSRSSTVTHVLEQINPNYQSQSTSTSHDHPPGSTSAAPFDATRPWLSHTPVLPNLYALQAANRQLAETQHDHWPVRVTLHTIDWDKMTLQGTMEAYDVPQHPASLSILGNNGSERPKAGKKSTPIITYLEGHIIDLRTHSFLTPLTTAPEDKSGNTANTTISPTAELAFPSTTTATDAKNWLRLPPFNTLPPTKSTDPLPTLSLADTAANTLLSTQALNHDLLEKYIFMRWKERCFIHTPNDPCPEKTSHSSTASGDQDRGHGLTISGFYYVSLRRADGKVEGVYFDPGCSPFQCLRLQGKAGGWGAWEFR
ncbi:hypothetical protein LTR86_008036 [Recurvomyces mirabilis]|nr:hypothetical protein LTR86_008036 [Recurvomyces mirabilis]